MYTNVKHAPFIISNRLVYEDYEDTEYRVHMKKINDIQSKKSRIDNSEPVRFPHLANNPKKVEKANERQNEINHLQRIQDDHIKKIRSSRGKIDNWNPLYDQRKVAMKENREAFKHRNRNEIQIENQRLKKRIKNVKGHFDLNKLEKDFKRHQSLLKIVENQYYTPRGMGHRKSISLPEIRTYDANKNKNAIKMLNEAVNKLERGDVVLMKTLVYLNYYERMETKKKYEKAYETDLKKGLIKVMDKQYEPLIQALLTDMNEHDVDRIYESLYNPNEAATVITDAFITRNLEQKASLLLAFHHKLDSELKAEIASKLDGELKTFLLSFLQNNSLDDELVDERQAAQTARDLKKCSSLVSDDFLEIIKTESRSQMRQIFNEFESGNSGQDFSKKFDQNKPVTKALRVIMSYLNSAPGYHADKLQRAFKTNKTEFLRILAIYPQDELEKIVSDYNKRYQTVLEHDIKSSFSDDLYRLIVRILHKNEKIQSNKIDNLNSKSYDYETTEGEEEEEEEEEEE